MKNGIEFTHPLFTIDNVRCRFHLNGIYGPTENSIAKAYRALHAIPKFNPEMQIISDLIAHDLSVGNLIMIVDEGYVDPIIQAGAYWKFENAIARNPHIPTTGPVIKLFLGTRQVKTLAANIAHEGFHHLIFTLTGSTNCNPLINPVLAYKFYEGYIKDCQPLIRTDVHSLRPKSAEGLLFRAPREEVFNRAFIQALYNEHKFLNEYHLKSVLKEAEMAFYLGRSEEEVLFNGLGKSKIISSAYNKASNLRSSEIGAYMVSSEMTYPGSTKVLLPNTSNVNKLIFKELKEFHKTKINTSSHGYNQLFCFDIKSNKYHVALINNKKIDKAKLLNPKFSLALKVGGKVIHYGFLPVQISVEHFVNQRSLPQAMMVGTAKWTLDMAFFYGLSRTIGVPATLATLAFAHIAEASPDIIHLYQSSLKKFPDLTGLKPSEAKKAIDAFYQTNPYGNSNILLAGLFQRIIKNLSVNHLFDSVRNNQQKIQEQWMDWTKTNSKNISEKITNDLNAFTPTHEDTTENHHLAIDEIVIQKNQAQLPSQTQIKNRILTEKQACKPKFGKSCKIVDIKIGHDDKGLKIAGLLASGATVGVSAGSQGAAGTAITVGVSVPLAEGFLFALGTGLIVGGAAFAALTAAQYFYKQHLKHIRNRINNDLQKTEEDFKSIQNNVVKPINNLIKDLKAGAQLDTAKKIEELHELNIKLTQTKNQMKGRSSYANKKNNKEIVNFYKNESKKLDEISQHIFSLTQDLKWQLNAENSAKLFENNSAESLLDILLKELGVNISNTQKYYEIIELSNLLVEKIIACNDSDKMQKMIDQLGKLECHFSSNNQVATIKNITLFNSEKLKSIRLMALQKIVQNENGFSFSVLSLSNQIKKDFSNDKDIVDFCDQLTLSIVDTIYEKKLWKNSENIDFARQIKADHKNNEKILNICEKIISKEYKTDKAKISFITSHAVSIFSNYAGRFGGKAMQKISNYCVTLQQFMPYSFSMLAQTPKACFQGEMTSWRFAMKEIVSKQVYSVFHPWTSLKNLSLSCDFGFMLFNKTSFAKNHPGFTHNLEIGNRLLNHGSQFNMAIKNYQAGKSLANFHTYLLENGIDLMFWLRDYLSSDGDLIEDYEYYWFKDSAKWLAALLLLPINSMTSFYIIGQMMHCIYNSLSGEHLERAYEALMKNAIDISNDHYKVEKLSYLLTTYNGGLTCNDNDSPIVKQAKLFVSNHELKNNVKNNDSLGKHNSFTLFSGTTKNENKSEQHVADKLRHYC